MLEASVRRRQACYRTLCAYLAGPEFLALAAGLAMAASTWPWEPGAAARGEAAGVEAPSGEAAKWASAGEGRAEPLLEQFAPARLAARLKRVRRGGRHMSSLSVPELHELRKDCKRLRYTAEFLAALYGGKAVKRFVAALSDLQEELGHLNDGAAIPGLMAQLGPRDRGYAAGLAEGFTAAQAGGVRARIERSWRRFRAAKPFWPEGSGKAGHAREAD